MATAEQSLTAEEYLSLPDNGQLTELVQGKIIPVNAPDPRRGQICSRVVRLVANYSDAHRLGHVVSSHPGIVTERDPDTVRKMDVAFYSYRQIPPGPLPEGSLPGTPKLVFEVPSATDRWREILDKVVDFLNAGVAVVCVLDPGTQTASVFDANLLPQVFGLDEELVFPEILGEFRVPVYRFFDTPPPLGGTTMTQPTKYQYLELRLGDSIRQPFVKSQKIWAEVLYRETVGIDPRTPEQVAADFDVPLGAVLEAIRYCEENEDFLREERERSNARLREFEKENSSVVPPDYKPES